ncbi:MAG TPA: hypothetical protein VMG82_12120 [Candidatus Sulfotelmatobacter sp.]|nr:hypothetical protein [Candidatus Sulfotelmatobacter sp.]
MPSDFRPMMSNGDAAKDASFVEIASGAAAKIMKEAPWHARTLAGRLPSLTKIPDPFAVTVEDEVDRAHPGQPTTLDDLSLFRRRVSWVCNCAPAWTNSPSCWGSRLRARAIFLVLKKAILLAVKELQILGGFAIKGRSRGMFGKRYVMLTQNVKHSDPQLREELAQKASIMASSVYRFRAGQWREQIQQSPHQ